MKIKIYSDKRFLPQDGGHVVMLYPFWGKISEDPQDPSSGRFDRYVAMGDTLFEMAPSIASASLAVLPAPWEKIRHNVAWRGLSEQFIDEARRAGKETVIFFWDDSSEPVAVNRSLVFRTSLHRSHQRPGEFAMPAWSEDVVAKYMGGHLPLREKRHRPVVGFSGFGRIRWTWKNMLHLGASKLGFRNPEAFVGHRLRGRGLGFLKKSRDVETNFIIRDAFYGEAFQVEAGNLALVQRFRQEFVQNLMESDYILCVRGNGNFSYRLYETLSCGRIPVFIDTDCVLPYDFAIDWKDYCVWVELQELPHIGEKVAEFHARLSPGDFKELQLRCRDFWQQWLSPEGFFANFYRHLDI
jgi:hypothetical protein